MSKNKKIIVVCALIIVLISTSFIGVLKFKKSDSTTSSDDTTKTQTYMSQEECEKSTNKECRYAMCDYVPEGKTYDEACGRGFKKGWQAVKSK